MNRHHPEHDVLQRYLDGELPEPEATAVEVRLRTESDLADELVRLAEEDAIFREWVQAQAVAASTQPLALPRRWRRAAVGLVAATATLAALMLLALMTDPRTDSSAFLATLEDVQGDVQIVGPNGAVELAENGRQLVAGQEIRTGNEDSSTVLRIHDSRLVLSSETHIRLTKIDPKPGQPSLLDVASGIVNAEFMRRPVVLRSANAELLGREGKFSFVSLPDATFIEAADGHGRLTRQSDGRTIDVKRGQFAVVRATEPLRSRPLPGRITRPTRSFVNGPGPVRGIFFDPERGTLMTASADSLRRWNLNSLRLLATPLTLKKRALRSVTTSSEGQRFALAADERQVRLIDGRSGADVWVKRGTRRAAAVALSPDGRTVAVSWAARDGHEVCLYDTLLGQERKLLTGHAGPVTALAWSSRGTRLATAGPDRSVRIWNALDLQAVRAITRLPVEVRTLAFSPDEELLAVGDRKGDVRLFQVETGSERHMLQGHVREVHALAFAPDGRWLASASGDGTTRLWQVADGRELGTFKAHASAVTAVAFSPDGRMIVTGGQDRKVHFWNPLARMSEAPEF